MRRWLACCICVATVAAGGCSSSADHRAAEQHLPNGVRVPKGANLVGVAAPTILPGGPYIGDPTGDHLLSWTALLTITGDPVLVYRGLDREATRLGLPPMTGGTMAGPCQSDYLNPDPSVAPSPATVAPASRRQAKPTPNNDVRCTGSTAVGDTTFSVTVVSCHSCKPRVCAADVRYQFISKRRIVRTPLLTPVAHHRGPAPRSTWPVLPGTRLLAQAELGQCTPSRYTVLEVTGAPDDVWKRYVARYGSSTAFEPTTTAVEATVDGARVRQVLGGETGQSEVVTLVQRLGLAHPVLTVTECSD